MSLASNISTLTTTIATSIKQVRTWVNGNDGNGVSNLNTTATNLVGAINEVKITADAAAGGGVAIDDATPSLTTTYSSSKIEAELADVSVDLTELIDDETDSATTVLSSTETVNRIGTASTADRARANHTGTQPVSTLSDFQSAVDARVTSGISTWVGAAPETLDTISEIATAIENNQDAIDTMNSVVNVSVRYDSDEQGLNGTQQANARTNIGAASQVDLTQLVTDVGETDSDFVATFNAGLA